MYKLPSMLPNFLVAVSRKLRFFYFWAVFSTTDNRSSRNRPFIHHLFSYWTHHKAAFQSSSFFTCNKKLFQWGLWVWLTFTLPKIFFKINSTKVVILQLPKIEVTDSFVLWNKNLEVFHFVLFRFVECLFFTAHIYNMEGNSSNHPLRAVRFFYVYLPIVRAKWQFWIWKFFNDKL